MIYNSIAIVVIALGLIVVVKTFTDRINALERIMHEQAATVSE